MAADQHIIQGISYTESPDEIRVFIPSRFDTYTAPTMEGVFGEFILRPKLIVADFRNCAFLSSAGMRVLLSVHKRNDGLLLLDNVHGGVRENLDIAGLAETFAINVPAEKLKNRLIRRNNQMLNKVLFKKICDFLNDPNMDNQTKRQKIIRAIDERFSNQ